MITHWFQALSPDGFDVAGTHIDRDRQAWLTLNGEPLGPNGHAPTWITDTALLFNGGPAFGTLRFDLSDGSILNPDPREFSELVSAAGKWAGRHAPSGTLVLSSGESFFGCGQPAMAPDGFVVFLADDNRTVRGVGITYASGPEMREPHVGESWVVWGQDGCEVWGCPRDGSLPAERLNVVPVEARPRVVDTPTGPWLLTMAGQPSTDLLLRPLRKGEFMGHRLALGNDRNLNADGRHRADGFRIVANTNNGEPIDRLIPHDQARIDLRAGTVPVPVPPPTPEPPQMADISKYLENRIDVVQAVKRDHPHLKGGAITDQVAHRLNRQHGVTVFGRKARQANGGDPNGDTLTIQRDPHDFSRKAMVDVLEGSKIGLDIPTWSVVPEHEEAGNGFWRPPVNADVDGTTQPLPVPSDGTHPYERDDDERDECNKVIGGVQCDKRKADPIHQVPTKPAGCTCRYDLPQPFDPACPVHGPGGGDGGDPGDEDDQPPVTVPPAGTISNEQLYAAILRLSNHLGVRP